MVLSILVVPCYCCCYMSLLLLLLLLQLSCLFVFVLVRVRVSPLLFLLLLVVLLVLLPLYFLSILVVLYFLWFLWCMDCVFFFLPVARVTLSLLPGKIVTLLLPLLLLQSKNDNGTKQDLEWNRGFLKLPIAKPNLSPFMAQKTWLLRGHVSTWSWGSWPGGFGTTLIYEWSQ